MGRGASLGEKESGLMADVEMTKAYIGRILDNAIEAGSAIDLGHEHWIVLHSRHGGADGVFVGGTIYHKSPQTGDWCAGGVTFDVPAAEGLGGARWTVHLMDPLHIEPSVLCHGSRDDCGDHGFIRDGQWVPA